MIAAAPAMAGMRRAERRVVIIFLSVPRLAVEPLSMRSSFETLSDMRRIPAIQPQAYAGGNPISSC
jgi:hypothetical protein